MSSSSSSGPGFLTLLAVLFIGPKLGGVIDWSWIWVLAPLWGGIALFLILIAVLSLVATVEWF